MLPLIHLFGIRSRQKTCRTDIRVNIDLASLLGPPGFFSGLGCTFVDLVPMLLVGLYGVGILFKFTAFLGTLHWPVGSEDLGHFGVSYLEFFILFEQWAGHRLLNENSC